MKLTNIKIKNYRTIAAEITIDVFDRVTIVGPNNSGKTNILNAVSLFFTSHAKNIYNANHDLPFLSSVDSGSSGSRTSIVATFNKSKGADTVFFDKYSMLMDCLEEYRSTPEHINLYLQFSTNSKPTYRFIINEKIKQEKQEVARQLQEELVLDLMDKFSCKYIPSEKNFEQIYGELVLPYLKQHIGDLLQNQLNIIQQSLRTISSDINKTLKDSGVDVIQCAFEVPQQKLSETIGFVDLIIDDGEKTIFTKKGSGVQSALLLSCLNWITKRDVSAGKDVIWLIEEPESYLHPGLIPSCNNVLDSISKNSTMLVTTHALGLIKDHEKTIGTYRNDNGTSLQKFKSYSEATGKIRAALGVRFSDYFDLGDYSIFVEGITDKKILEQVLEMIEPKGQKNHFTRIRKAKIVDLSGVSKLKDFLKSTYAQMRDEICIAVIFDGDDAGKKAMQDLRGYLEKKSIKFRSNEEYFFLPNSLPIEGMFPQDWINDLEKINPTWCSRQLDIDGKPITIEIPDDKKQKVSDWLLDRARTNTSTSGHYAWAQSFIKLFDLIEKSFASNDPKIKFGVRM